LKWRREFVEQWSVNQKTGISFLIIEFSILEKNSKMKNFKDLEAWRKGRALRIDIAALTKIFPNDEKFNLLIK